MIFNSGGNNRKEHTIVLSIGGGDEPRRPTMEPMGPMEPMESVDFQEMGLDMAADEMMQALRREDAHGFKTALKSFIKMAED